MTKAVAKKSAFAKREATKIEQQQRQECGLCALRNVLRPLMAAEGIQESQLPVFGALAEEARRLEGGEAALLEDEEAENSDAERADGVGNFGIEVLVQSVAACPHIAGKRLRLEYWGGRHLEASEDNEFGFILGCGSHWWCIRRGGKDATGWEEVDSLKKSRCRMWEDSEQVRSFLQTCEETVLVLYPSQEEEVEERSAPEEIGKKGRAGKSRQQQQQKSKEYLLVAVDADGGATLVDEAQMDKRLEGLRLPSGTYVEKLQCRLESGEMLKVLVRPGRQSFKKGKILEIIG